MERRGTFGEFCRYASLNVLGMIGLSCYILADTFFIARRLGADGLTALNLAIPIYSVVRGCGLMIGIGGATRYAIHRSRGEGEKARFVFSLSGLLAVCFGAAFFLAGLLFSGPIAGALGADASVFEMTETYLRVILLFAPAFLANDLLICFVRNDGGPRLAMAAMLAGSLSNILLDYLFLFPLGLGLFGAVLATGFAPFVSIAVLVFHLRSAGCGLRLQRSAPQLRLTGAILTLGLPSFVSEVSSGVVIAVFNGLILGLRGNVGVAAYGVVANLALVATAVYTGVAQGMQPLVSAAYGRGDTAETRKLLGYGLGTAALFGSVIYLVALLGAEPLAAVFNSEQNPALQEIAALGLRLYFLGGWFAGGSIVLTLFFTSVTRAAPAQLLSLLRGVLLVLPVAFLFAALWGMTGVWLALPVTEFAVFLLGAGVYLRGRER